MLSYAHGACDEPLLGETIGHNLERTVARVPDAEALVSCHQGVRYTYAEFERAVDRAGQRDARGRAGQGRPRRRVGPEPRRVGARPVRHGEARGDPGQHQPGLPGQRAPVRARASRAAAGCSPPRSQGLGLRRRWSTRCAPSCPSSSGRCSSAPTSGTSWPAAGGRRRGCGRSMDELDFDDPINIQYTSGTTGFPKGATLTHHNILNNGYFVGELLGYTERDRVCIPVPLYHCFGMVIGNLAADHARRLHGLSGRDVRARGDAAGLRRGALHEPVRRADDVHRRAGAPELRRATT